MASRAVKAASSNASRASGDGCVSPVAVSSHGKRHDATHMDPLHVHRRLGYPDPMESRRWSSYRCLYHHRELPVNQCCRLPGRSSRTAAPRCALWPTVTPQPSLGSPHGWSTGHRPRIGREWAGRRAVCHGGPHHCGRSLRPPAGLGTTRGPIPHASPRAANRPWAASHMRSTVSSMRALRPRCTTGSWRVHRSRLKACGLMPSHRRASVSGMSWGGAGISRGKGNCGLDGSGRDRRRRDGAAMVRVAPRRGWTFDTVERRTPQTWASIGAAASARSAHHSKLRQSFLSAGGESTRPCLINISSMSQ
jgi:hypothetical protein